MIFLCVRLNQEGRGTRTILSHTKHVGGLFHQAVTGGNISQVPRRYHEL